MYSWEINEAAAWDSQYDFTIARPVGIPVRSCPVPSLNIEYQLEQDYMQASAYWSALKLNTPHPDFTTFLLVAESPRMDLGGGIVKWKRTYIQPPAQHFEPETYGYNFIGFMGAIYQVSGGIGGVGPTPVGAQGGSVIAGRTRQTKSVTSRVQNDYFAVGTGMTYATGFAIPTISAQLYYGDTTLANNLFTDYLVNAIGAIPASTPSLTTYRTWIADAVANGWAGTIGIIVAEDSRLTRWMGNIFVRKTRYVLAL